MAAVVLQLTSEAIPLLRVSLDSVPQPDSIERGTMPLGNTIVFRHTHPMQRCQYDTSIASHRAGRRVDGLKVMIVIRVGHTL